MGETNDDARVSRRLEGEAQHVAKRQASTSKRVVSVANLGTVSDPYTSSPMRPATLAIGTIFEQTPVQQMSSSKRAELGRTVIVGTLHVILASSMLSTLPMLEMFSLFHDIWAVHYKYSSLVLAGDLCAIWWCSLALLRLAHVLSIFFALHVFAFHFIIGFFDPQGTHSFRGFWAEYCGAYMFAQLMMLAAISSWFADPEVFYALPPKFQTLALGLSAAQGWWSTSFCVPNIVLIGRNVSYSEVQLASLFDRMKFQEKTFQTLLDLQLAFVRKVHLISRKVCDAEGLQGGAGGSVGRSSLLAQQLKIVVSVGLGIGREAPDGARVGGEEPEPAKKRGRGRSRPRSRSRGQRAN